MTLTEKSQLVEILFSELDTDIQGFQTKTGIQCKTGCGKCCFKPDITATILEFIPFAYWVYKQGTADSLLEKINLSPTSICVLFYSQDTILQKGFCSQYPHRGLICRLFGFSAGTDKYGSKRYITCSIIKQKTEQYTAIEEQIKSNSLYIPIMSDYQARLRSIDFELGTLFYPINEALKKAIELVLFQEYYKINNE
ncbi:MAG: YkgJ family cysteine cluster protein [Chitinophagaceae bacterium]|nr:YkgJ family cysteine cluster protein [Chitinophagaceae bacterium]